MKRTLTATCLAATFAVGLAAQATSTTTPQDPAAPGQRGGGPRTVTGCLRAGDTAGTYMLTDVVMPGARRGGDPTTIGTAGSTAAAGTTAAGTPPAGSTEPGTMPQGGGAMMAPQSFLLSPASDIDLKAHVGHKIEVTGTMAGRGGGAGMAGTATATGTTAGSTAAGATTTASGTATGTGTTGTAGGGQGMGRGGPRTLNVTAIKMVSDSCS